MKELSQIVQESVKKFNKEFTASGNGDWVSSEDGDLYEGEPIINFLILSQISLLEAELERKKGMMKREHGDTVIPNSHGLIIETLGEKRLYNQAIQEDIDYLQDQITKCKELLK